MKWIYGKHDWKTIERGQENCFLMTNGLGGFSSMTILGSAARNDHAALMACLHAPNQRWNLIHWLEEMLTADGEETALSTQEFADGSAQRGPPSAGRIRRYGVIRPGGLRSERKRL